MRRALVAGLLAGCSSSNLVFQDTNNYTFKGELGIQAVEVQAQADSAIDWSAVTTDVRGRPFDGSVDQVLLVEFRGSQQSILDGLNNNTLVQADVQDSFLIDDPAGTSVMLSELEIIGNQFEIGDFDAVDPSDRNWLATIANTSGTEFDVLMSKFVVPTDASSNTAVDIDDACTTFDILELDLASAPPLEAKAGKTTFLDWSGLTVDVHGNPFNPELADRLLVARFDVAGLDEIEDLFLRLDSEAAEIYTISSFGITEADLAEAVDDAGAAFAGFTADGVWLVGLLCSTCLNPAPVALTVVEVQ